MTVIIGDGDHNDLRRCGIEPLKCEHDRSRSKMTFIFVALLVSELMHKRPEQPSLKEMKKRNMLATKDVTQQPDCRFSLRSCALQHLHAEATQFSH